MKSNEEIEVYSMCKSKKTIDDQNLKFIKGVIETEDPSISDMVYRMALARMKLFVSENGQDALIWMIRFLVRTHPDPRPVFDFAIEVSDDCRQEMSWIATVMENELERRYNEIAKRKDRK